ncbi:TonB-linked outer membrane protein, SusC/RagA family [bacterium A37T11]|nr:TonB-linked outer membrane protein, SusC/RagA family [bacterium A37T11]
MRITTILLFSFFLQLSAKSYSQVTISVKNEPLARVLKQIQAQTGYAYINKNLDISSLKVTLTISDASIDKALQACLDPLNLQYYLVDKIVVITEKRPVNTPNAPPSAQPEKSTGKVTDENGKPLAGAFVKVVGLRITMLTTDKEGNFQWMQQPGDTALQIRYLGYKNELIKLEKKKSAYVIRLKPVNEALEDVVVTGMFDKPKESYVGAVTVISKEQIKMYGNRNLLKTIGNIDPSFDIQERNTLGSDPNSLPDIEIRGSTTLADISDLQSNVRNTLNLPLFILDGFEVSLQRVYDMNESDVESVVILKDASSTAMYGSRGANGVVVITSIKPEAGKLRVSYSAGLNLELPDLSSYKRLGAADKLALEKSVGLYNSTDLYTQSSLSELYNTNLKSVVEGVNTNWAKVPVHNGVGQYHKLDLTGGDNQFRYILNASYDQITGAMKGSKRNNFNGSMSIMYLLSKVRFTNNLSIGFNNSANSTYGDFSNYLLMNPYWNPYKADGSAVQQFTSFNGTQPNPAYNGSLTDFNKGQYTLVRNTTSVEWDITQGLRWNNSVGYTREVGGTDVFKSPSNLDFLQYTQKGSYSKTNGIKQGYQFRTNLSFGKTIEKHSVFFGVNAQVLQNQNSDNTIMVTGFANDTQTDISNGSSYSGTHPSTSEATVRSVGMSATANYNYDSRYFADATYSMEGGSSFGPNTRFGKFYSLGLGWTISNEHFFADNLPFIGLMRLKYNYGVSGGLNFAPYQSLTTYTYDRTQQYFTLVGATMTALGNPDLSWQNTFQHNVGVDLTLFNGFVSLSANYYRKYTPNTITQAVLPSSHGFDSYTENLGEVHNYGTDISTSIYLIRNNDKKMSWSVQAAVSNNKNILVKLSEAIKTANEKYASQNSGNSTYYEYVEGKSIDEIYVLKSPGVDAATGKVLYEKPDGTLTTNLAGLQKIAVGSAQPKVNGRMSTTVRYGSLVANIGFAARLGGKKLNQTLLSNVENAYVRTNVDQRVLDLRWQKPGDITAYKSITATDVTYANDRFVFTENTVMLNNVNLSYELPIKWVKHVNMQHVSVTASMSDLAYWSNIDQERGTSYPYTLKPSFTLSCTF